MTPELAAARKARGLPPYKRPSYQHRTRKLCATPGCDNLAKKHQGGQCEALCWKCRVDVSTEGKRRRDRHKNAVAKKRARSKKQQLEGRG